MELRKMNFLERFIHIKQPLENLFIKDDIYRYKTYNHNTKEKLYQRFINDFIHNKLLKPNRFLHTDISSYIEKNVYKYTYAQWNIKDIIIEVWIGHLYNYVINTNIIIQIMNDLLHTVLSCLNITQLDDNRYAFIFIPSPFEKCIPIDKQEKINEFHINSGYTQFNLDGDINLLIPNQCSVIYREEEWEKVFIHECLHIFKADEGLQISLSSLNVDKPYYETYCEFWALYIISLYNSKIFNRSFTKEYENICRRCKIIWNKMKRFDLSRSHPNIKYYFKYPLYLLNHTNNYIHFIIDHHNPHSLLQTPTTNKKKYYSLFKQLLHKIDTNHAI